MKYFIFALMFFSANILSGQDSEDKYLWYSKQDNDNKVSYGVDVNYNLGMGSNYSYFGRGNNAFSYYASPSATVNTGKKSSFTVGLIMNMTQGTGYFLSQEGSLQQRNFSQNQAIVYVSGAHQVNPNITVFASGYYDMNSRNAADNPYNNFYSPYGTEGFSMGAEFKIGNKSKLGIFFQYDKGSNPYMNPYNGYGMGGFGNTGFTGYPYRRF